MAAVSPLDPTLVALPLLDDGPIETPEQDGLGMRRLAQVVAEVSLAVKGAFTIGVFGGWGVGKTSILRLAKHHLNQSEPAQKGQMTTVSFEAWRYEQDENPLVPLVATIVDGLNNNKKHSDAAKKLLNAFRSLLFGLSASIKSEIPSVGNVQVSFAGDKYIKRYNELKTSWLDDQIEQNLHSRVFKEVQNIQKECEESSHRIVVFIDDLDRCFPGTAVSLLQKIKIVLNQPKIVFVIAVDHLILERYIQNRCQEYFGLQEYYFGQSYLDKIVQLPLWIPSHESRFDRFMNNLMDTSVLHHRREDFEPLVDEIGFACDHNPRQLKRFLNDLLIDQKLFADINPGRQLPLGPFVVARGIRHQNEAILHWLTRDPRLCGLLSRCADDNAMKAVLDDTAEKSVSESEKVLARELRDRESLLRLLTTPAGRQWLEQQKTRIDVENFLAEERPSGADRWHQEQLHRALSQLNASDDDLIVGGCLALRLLPVNLAARARNPLIRLSRTGSKTVQDHAKAALAHLDGSDVLPLSSP